MDNNEKKKTIKTIVVDVDKCNGCQACEMVCSALHATPKYSSVNPARSRIRVLREPLSDIYVPVYAGNFTKSECPGRNIYTMGGKEYPECGLCRVSCPARDLFKEPDSGLPLKCDMCEGEEDGPLCVKWCVALALTCEEREEDVEEEMNYGDLEMGLETLKRQHGLEKIVEALDRVSEKNLALRASD